jgi:hypothetical protein
MSFQIETPSTSRAVATLDTTHAPDRTAFPPHTNLRVKPNEKPLSASDPDMKRIWSRVRVERTVWQIVRSIGDALRLSTKQEQVPGAWEAQSALDLPGGLDAIRNANSWLTAIRVGDCALFPDEETAYTADS